MRSWDARLIIGLLLIGGGLFYLLDTLEIITWGGLVWGAAALVGGLAFLSVLARDRAAWWAALPGVILLSLAVLIGLDYFAPAIGDQWGGAIFLGGIGAAFLVVYALNRANWWALIPGGVLLTLALVTGLDDVAGINGGGVFFLGLAATFAVVALLPTPHGAMRWAFLPAAVLGLMGLLLLVGFERGLNFIWPVALILAGLFLLTRVVRRQP
jgi:hypothetical protein